MSVGYHLTAYGGRDDGLFRGGIMESGGSISASALHNATYYQDQFDALASKVGCADVADKLQCLREVPFEKLNGAINGTNGSPAYEFSPYVDGDLVRTRGSEQLNQHEFVQVPIIAGTNSDEGTSFGPTGLNTTQQFYSYLTGLFSSSFKNLCMVLIKQTNHPDLPSHPPTPNKSSPSTPTTPLKASQPI